MKTRWLLVFVALTAMALACSTGLEKRSWTTITSITVLPPMGEKDFSLEVKYQYTWDRQFPNAEIYCMYTSPSGNTTPIGSIVPAELDRDRESFSKVEILTFTVKPKDGKIEPGTYIAGCATEHESSMVTNTFTVIESATPTPEPPSNPVPTPSGTSQPPAATIKGKIVFDYTGYQSSRPSGGGELDIPTSNCIPEVTITPDGVVSGICERLHVTARLVDESFSAQVIGRVDQAGNITFSYDVSEIGTPDGTWRISYEGQGKFSSATQGMGTASFSFSCASGQDNLLWCNGQTDESFSGTVPWSFIPTP